jgi:hypothetical protein
VVRWTILSSSAVTPSGRSRPSALGMYTLRTGFHPSDEDQSPGTLAWPGTLRASVYGKGSGGYHPHMRAFYRSLRERHKTGLQALMAVAHKLLHAIYGIFKSGKPYDGKLLFPKWGSCLSTVTLTGCVLRSNHESATACTALAG